MPILTGHGGFVRFVHTAGTTVMHAIRFTVDMRVDALDETTFVNANWGQHVNGVQDYEISVDCLFDTTSDLFPVGGLSAAQNVFIAAALQPGCNMGIFAELDEGNAVRRWSFPETIILDVRIDDSVRDLLRFSVSARASLESSSGGPAVAVPTLPVA